MSQSRNRRPMSRAREPPRAAAAPRAGYVTRDATENYGNKSTYKIPKAVRYELENALVGLCDIWFEEIKPHLVKNKLKVHTGGALNEELEPGREHRSGPEESRRAPSRLLDPGAASDIRRPAGSCRGCLPTRPAASRAPSHRQPSQAKPTPLNPTNFRKLLQLPEHEATRQPARSTPAPPRLPQTYQRNALSVQQRADDLRKELPGRRSTPITSLAPAYQQNGPNILKQSTTSNRKTRKSKRMQRIPDFPFSLPQQPQRQLSRPCCIACALAANAQITNDLQRPLAATQLPVPGTKNSLPPKTLPDNQNANSKLRRVDAKIPHVSYPTQQPTASAILLPRRVTRISPSGDLPPSPQIAFEKCSYLHGASGIQNSLVKNNSKNRSASVAPFPPFNCKRNFPLPLRASNISPAGDLLPSQHVEVSNFSSPQVAAGSSLPLQGFTCIRNPVVRKATQNHFANIAPVPPKFGRNWPLPPCATNMLPAVGPPTSMQVAAGDSPNPSDFADSRKPIGAARISSIPPYFKTKSPCPLRDVGILPPTHAKCMSPAQARSQSPVSSHGVVHSPPPSEDETWFHRVFMDPTLKRRPEPGIQQNSIPVNNVFTPSSHTIPIHQDNELKIEYNRPLFSKELIDLIGDKNDERLRVLYENPALGESHPSVMQLVGSRNKRRNTAPKKMPWR